MIALFMSTALLLGPPGVAVAQTTTTAPAQEKKTEEKDHRDEAGDVSGEGWERPSPKKADCEKKFVATSKTGKAVTRGGRRRSRSPSALTSLAGPARGVTRDG